MRAASCSPPGPSGSWGRGSMCRPSEISGRGCCCSSPCAGWGCTGAGAGRAGACSWRRIWRVTAGWVSSLRGASACCWRRPAAGRSPNGVYHSRDSRWGWWRCRPSSARCVCARRLPGDQLSQKECPVIRSVPGGVGLVFLGWLAGCHPGSGGTPPHLTTCNTAGGQNVTLAVAAYQAIPPLANAGCLLFPGNPSSTDSALYLIVPQLATDSQGATAAFILQGDTLHPALAAALTQRPATASDLGMRFHDFLRTQQRSHWGAIGGPQLDATRPVVQQGPPDTLGNVRQFSVCGDLNCSTFPKVTATAKSVSGHLAIYVDNAAPAAGLTQTDLDSLASLFNSRLYAIDTTAFGRESDIDNNGAVIVLMTNVVNKLVSKSMCKQSGFIAGFFFGADIDPLFSGDNRVNHGEVFY